MNYLLIKQIAQKNKYSLKKLATDAGLTEAGFHRMIDRKSMKVEMLEKISALLNVSIASFFPEENLEVVQEEKGVYSAMNFQRKYINCIEEKNDLLLQIVELQKEISLLKSKLITS